MPTAYLSPSLLQDLTNVSVGAGNTGYPLVWNNATGRFELAVLGVAGGGTGTSNGSITGTGALTFAAGGTNQNITLQPSGTGIVSCSNTVVAPGSRFGDSPLTPGRVSETINRTNAEGRRIVVENYVASNQGDSDYILSLATRARGTLTNPSSVQIGDRVFGFFCAARGNQSWQGYSSGFLFEVDGFVSGEPEQRILFYTGGFGDVPFKVFPRTIQVAAATQSTSTTNGALTVSGGVGIALNLNVGGNLKISGSAINFPNLPTTSTGLNPGDVWRDSNGFLRIV